jgi:hypothetical protein
VREISSVRLVGAFPDKMRAVHEATVRYSRKTEIEVLATLEAIVGKGAADAVRAVLGPPGMAP